MLLTRPQSLKGDLKGALNTLDVNRPLDELERHFLARSDLQLALIAHRPVGRPKGAGAERLQQGEARELLGPARHAETPRGLQEAGEIGQEEVEPARSHGVRGNRFRRHSVA